MRHWCSLETACPRDGFDGHTTCRCDFSSGICALRCWQPRWRHLRLLRTILRISICPASSSEGKQTALCSILKLLPISRQQCEDCHYVYTRTRRVGREPADKENQLVSCRICGGSMESRITDLPFKTGDFSIVIVKALPVLQRRQCSDTELDHQTMLRVDELLSGRDKSAELEVIRYAA
jgi:hypothetical protein